jgi:hypothetical protein
MAYNKINFYERVAEIQDIVREHSAKGVPYSWVYRNLIKHQYHISVSTFYNYLGIPARAKLKELKEPVNNE